MKKIVSIVLVMALLASAVSFVITPAAAQQAGIPCDDGDNELTKEELVNAILPYMLEEEGAHTLDEVGDAAWVYAYWSENPKTITDSKDRVVTIYKPVERIVTLSEYPAEVIRMFREQDMIVGIHSTTKNNEIYFPEISKLPSVGGAFNPDIEAILSLDPDLVFAWTYKIAELDEKLPESVVVVGLDLYKPRTLAEDIEKCGYILDKEDEASHYLDDFYNKYLDIIKDQTEGLSEEERPTVYIDGTFGKGGSDCQTFGSKSGAQMIIEMAGGRNIFADLPGSMPHVDLEVVLWRNPDIIIRYCGSGEGGYGVDHTSKMETLRESVINPMANVTAVKNNSIYIMDKGPTYGPDVPISALYWAKWFHPDLFDELDPKAIHQEWLTEFQGLDYDLDEHGVFVYHPEKHPDGK